MADRKLKVVRPLPPGTIIKYNFDEAEVIEDKGYKTLRVLSQGVEEVWSWELEGVCCQVVRYPHGYEPPSEKSAARDFELMLRLLVHKVRKAGVTDGGVLVLCDKAEDLLKRKGQSSPLRGDRI